jgi:hypothetical protein
MNLNPRTPARYVIVAGYLLIAASTVDTFITVTSSSAFSQLSSSFWILEISFSLAALSALTAWWFLSQLSPTSRDQESLLRRGFIAMGVQLLLGTFGEAYNFLKFFNQNWTDHAGWLSMVGGITGAIGFFMTAREYVPLTNEADDIRAFDQAMAEEGPNIPFDEVVKELGWS